MKYLLVAVSAFIAATFVASTPARAAKLTCLTGTDPSVAGDNDQIAAVRVAINSDCPCADYDGSPGNQHADYVKCATDTIKAEVAAGDLRKQCKAAVTAYYKLSACGFDTGEQRAPCIKKTLSNGKLSCAIKPISKCVGSPGKFDQTVCPSFANCIDAGDTNRDGMLGAGDDGACRPKCGNGTQEPGEECDPPGSSTGCPSGKTCSIVCTCLQPPATGPTTKPTGPTPTLPPPPLPGQPTPTPAVGCCAVPGFGACMSGNLEGNTVTETFCNSVSLQSGLSTNYVAGGFCSACTSANCSGFGTCGSAPLSSGAPTPTPPLGCCAVGNRCVSGAVPSSTGSGTIDAQSCLFIGGQLADAAGGGYPTFVANGFCSACPNNDCSGCGYLGCFGGCQALSPAPGTCGNKKVEAGEECDPTGSACPVVAGVTGACNSSCKCEYCQQGSSCICASGIDCTNNDAVCGEIGEQCVRTPDGRGVCVGFTGSGNARSVTGCQSNSGCQPFQHCFPISVPASPTPTPVKCGNGVVDPGEECDLGGVRSARGPFCPVILGQSGSCNASCQCEYCTGHGQCICTDGADCTNQACPAPETCVPNPLGGKVCVDQTIANCTSNGSCRSGQHCFPVPPTPTPVPVCGNGVREGSVGGSNPGDEDCDGTDNQCPTLTINGVTVTPACNQATCKCEFCSGVTTNPPGAAGNCLCTRGYSCPPCDPNSAYPCLATCPSGEACVTNNGFGVCLGPSTFPACFGTGTCCGVKADCQSFEYCVKIPSVPAD